ncbi:MAG: polysaccharide deacetylase family protein [Bacilli bacterium]|nr:polysaccharide deacetylase family protein [Bacilli bacterium]
MIENKKKKTKIKKSGLIILIVLFLIIIGGLVTLKILNDLKQKEIKEYFNKTVSLNKNSNIYYNNKKIGTNLESIKLELESIKGKYFKVKNTNYYVYYKDVKKEKFEEKNISNNYVLLNKNIKTNKKIDLYEEDKKIFSLNSINTPIEAMDKDNYYISFLNNTYKVKKDKAIKEIKSNNTKEKIADHISVLFYEFIRESCNDYNCTTIENFKNTINKLKESGYYTITDEEFKNYISGKKNLKDKAIYINTANYNDTITNLNNELKININKLEETYNYRFISTYKPVKSNDNQKYINRYQIKSYTTIDNILKMAKGEEVKQSSDDEVSRQGVPVLNYHFFYDKNEDTCDESICLEVTKFEEHLKYLKDNNFKTLTMEEFKKWMYGEIEIPSNSVLITVDDGAKGTGKHNGNKLNPLLEKYKLNATLFLITGWWNLDNYIGDYLDIQSHTNDMHQYGSCGRGQINCYSYEKAKADIDQSIAILGNTDSFCFPFYMYSETSLRVIKDAGFKLAFIGGNVNARRTNDKWLIPRYPIGSNITLNQFANIVN